MEQGGRDVPLENEGAEVKRKAESILDRIFAMLRRDYWRGVAKKFQDQDEDLGEQLKKFHASLNNKHLLNGDQVQLTNQSYKAYSKLMGTMELRLANNEKGFNADLDKAVPDAQTRKEIKDARKYSRDFKIELERIVKDKDKRYEIEKIHDKYEFDKRNIQIVFDEVDKTIQEFVHDNYGVSELQFTKDMMNSYDRMPEFKKFKLQRQGELEEAKAKALEIRTTNGFGDFKAQFDRVSESIQVNDQAGQEKAARELVNMLKDRYGVKKEGIRDVLSALSDYEGKAGKAVFKVAEKALGADEGGKSMPLWPDYKMAI